MSKRFTDGYFALGLGVGSITVIVLALLISEYGSGCYLADGNSFSYQGNGGGPTERCWLIPNFIEFGDTLVDWLMFFLTVVTVLLIWRTLDLTRRANEAAVEAAKAANEANQIMRSESRPWVSLSNFAVRSATDLGHGIEIDFSCLIENKGKSPAFNVSVQGRALKRPHIQNLADESENFAASASRYKRTDFPVLFPDKTIEFPRSMMLRYLNDDASSDKSLHVVFLVCVTYRRSFGDKAIGFDVAAFCVDFNSKTGKEAATLREIPSGRFIA